MRGGPHGGAGGGREGGMQGGPHGGEIAWIRHALFLCRPAPLAWLHGGGRATPLEENEVWHPSGWGPCGDQRAVRTRRQGEAGMGRCEEARTHGARPAQQRRMAGWHVPPARR